MSLRHRQSRPSDGLHQDADHAAQARTLSDEAAVEMHEFLEVIAANFMRRYGQRIYRHYAKQAKRKFKNEKPWEHSHPGESF